MGVRGQDIAIRRGLLSLEIGVLAIVRSMAVTFNFYSYSWAAPFKEIAGEIFLFYMESKEFLAV